MKVQVIGAGASWSTKDVENGVVEGLRDAGVTVGRYALDQRLSVSADYLHWIYRRTRKHDANVPEPKTTDVQIHALKDALSAAVAHGVDWVVIVSGMFVPLAMVDVMRKAGLPVAMLLTESPYDLEHELRWAALSDLVWTTERSSVEAFRAVQPRSFFLPHAYRPSVHAPGGDADADVPAHDVVFVGSCFTERYELLHAINWDGIDLGLYGNWGRLPGRSRLRRFVREAVIDNRRSAALYRRAKVGLNLYRQSKGWSKDAPRISHAESLNPRAYELAACGCFAISDYRQEVGERFGDLVPTFTTPFECESLIRRWMADDEGRARVRAALPATVAGETWQARGRQMAQQMAEALPAALDRVAADVAERKRRAA